MASSGDLVGWRFGEAEALGFSDIWGFSGKGRLTYSGTTINSVTGSTGAGLDVSGYYSTGSSTTVGVWFLNVTSS